MNPTYMICHIEDGAVYPLPHFDDTFRRDYAVYDLMTLLDKMIRQTALQACHNLTISSTAIHIAAPDAEYSIAVVEIPWVNESVGEL